MAADIVEQDRLVTLAAEIVTAYVTRNHVQAAELPGLLKSVHAGLLTLSSGSAEPALERRTLTAAEIRRSVRPEGLISFEDGKAYKTLRRHLTKHGLTPEAYREKWGLPADYPMTAAAYSAQRSQLALKLGPGHQLSLMTEEAAAGLGESIAIAESRLAQAASSDIPTRTEVLRQANDEDEFDERVAREPFEDDDAAP